MMTQETQWSLTFLLNSKNLNQSRAYKNQQESHKLKATRMTVTQQNRVNFHLFSALIFQSVTC